MIKDIVGYEGLYEVSDSGEIFSLNYRRTGVRKILKCTVNTAGYWSILLSKNRVVSTFRVHRLVAIAFIPNPENKREVNHKDANKLNNSVENLEWCTPLENSNHAIQMAIDGTNRYDNRHFKKVINTKTGEVYNNITVAAKSIGYIRSRLSHMLRGVNRNKTDFKYL